MKGVPSTPERLRALRPVCIPIFGPVGQRKGPKIIAVKRAESPTPRAVEGTLTQIPQTHGVVAAPKPASPAVRLGRLPPRNGSASASGPSRTAGFEPIAVAATLPRRLLAKQRWSHIEARAARLGLALDAGARAVVRAVVEGTSTLSIAARGRTHELAALAGAMELPQAILVVGPDARALADLRERLERAGARCTLLNDMKGPSPNGGVLDAIATGGVKVVLATPRWLAQDAVLRALGRAGVGVAVVLEAHAVSPLSAGFSAAHARLSLYLERLGRPPVVALAPGANAEIRHDIAEGLLPGAPELIAEAPLAANVALSVLPCARETRRRALSEAARKLPRPMLVLFATPREVDAAYDSLRSLGFPTHRYHEDMKAGVRAGEQLEFTMPGEDSILVATSAFAPSALASDDDPEGVPLRFGRRTAKADIRSLVRFEPPASLEQLADELSLLGRDGKPAQAMVFHDPSDRPSIEAQTDATRPSGEQILLLGRGLETMPSGRAFTTEALALAGRTSLRTVEALSHLLDAMGLVTHRDGWLTRLAPESVVLKELRALAERYATVRVLDCRRLAGVMELVARAGCRTAALVRALGGETAKDCGACTSCSGESESDAGAPAHARQAPVRRFAVQTLGVGGETAGTFHADERLAARTQLTAKLADFR
jgi:ATP-dependent DNA helicase RecQ